MKVQQAVSSVLHSVIEIQVPVTMSGSDSDAMLQGMNADPETEWQALIGGETYTVRRTRIDTTFRGDKYTVSFWNDGTIQGVESYNHAGRNYVGYATLKEMLIIVGYQKAKADKVDRLK